MTVRKKVWLTFIAVVLLTLLAGLVNYPKGVHLTFWKINWSYDRDVQLGLDLRGGVSLTYDADTSAIPDAERASALDGVRDVIERRVNAFGVGEPVVQTQKVGDQWRVIVELPGVTDVNEAIRRIGETPLLEFKEEESAPPVDPDAIAAANAEVKKTADGVLSQALASGADFSALAKQYTEDTASKENGGDLGWARQGQFVDAFDTALFSTLKDGEISPALVETEFGYHIIQRVESRTADENGEQIQEVHGRHILFRTQSANQSPNFVTTGLSGKNLKRASVVFDPNTNQPQVSLQFDGDGAKLFQEITERNVGKTVAIYLDGAPISLPTVQQSITSGEAVITGSFTLKEARQLSQRLNSGALPVPVSLVTQQNIGATLGEKSIAASFRAGLIGLAAIALFMILYYRLPGLLAVLALGFYSMAILAIFKLWPITLTLAGIAGFILSIGMAVDANILIFERMKEELRGGRPLDAAIDEGFARAWLSIRDSNVSSLLTCLILTWFGTSIIKGFAITLAIGILVSLFSAITVTRTLMRLIHRWTGKSTWLYGVRNSQKAT